MEIEVQNIRKFVLGWQGPTFLAALVAMSYSSLTAPFSTLQDISIGAPMLRLYPAEIFGPTFIVSMFAVCAVLVLKAIPVRKSIINLARWWGMALVLLNVPLFLFALVFARPLQHHYLPKHGYTQCDQLQGNPTIWFTDWVKNPSWCVRGKDRKWVLEQSRLTQETTPPSAETK